MSDFTDFFPAGGGSGGGSGSLVTNPRDLNFTSTIPTDFFYVKSNNSGQAKISSNQWFTQSYSPFNSDGLNYDQAQYVSINTYQTITDLTNVKGGILHGVLASSMLLNVGGGSGGDFRITVDGTEYVLSVVFPSNWNQSEYHRMALGNFIPMQPWISSDSNTTVSNIRAHVFNSKEQGYNDPSTLNRVPFRYDSYAFTDRNQVYMLPSNPRYLGGVTFKESLKVEWRQLTAPEQIGSGGDDAICFTTIF